MQSKETLRGSAKYYNCVTSVQINWRKFKDNKLELCLRGTKAGEHYMRIQYISTNNAQWYLTKILQFVV